MGIKEIVSIIKDQGLGKILKYYHHYNQLGILLFFAPFLYRTKVGQEQLREIISYRVQNKFRKKFFNHNFCIQEDMEGNVNRFLVGREIIWTAWFQGIENAPKLVKLNYTLLGKCSNKKVILITNKNIKEYVSLPRKIYEKWESGIIPDTQFSDIVRIELLATYGGVWIDATVAVTKNLPDYFNDDVFLYQSLKPGKNGLAIPISSWVIAAKNNNELILRTRDLILTYWLVTEKNFEYFVFHRLFCVAMEEKKKITINITPVDNSQPHALLIASKNKILSKDEIKKLIELSSIHKLSYKMVNDIQEQNHKRILNVISDLK